MFPVVISLCDYIFVCMSVAVCFHLAKIDQAGGPQLFS